MKKEEVFSLLGKGEYLERYYYFDSELAIDFDSDNRVEFIEFLAGKDGNLEPVIYGCPVFDADAGEVFELLKEKNAGAIEDNENGYSYAFVNLQLGIYREATLEAVQRDIEDMKKDGIEDPEYIEEQLEKAKHWSTVGIGKKGYY